MKKVLAILLCMLMVFTGSAMAVSKELTIENVQVYMDDQVILDLSGIELNLAIGENAEYGGIMAGIGANGKELLNGIVAIGAEEIVLGMTGLSDYYSINLEELVSLIEAELAAQGLTLEDLVNEAMGGVSSAMTMDTATIEQLLEDAMTVLGNSMTDGGTTDIDGVTYQVINVRISQADMQILIDDLAAVLDVYAADSLEGTGYDNYAALMADAGVASYAEGTIYANEEVVVVDLYQTLVDTISETEETIEHYVEVYMYEGETADELVTEIWYSLYLAEDNYTDYVMQIGVMTVETAGEFGGFYAQLEIEDVLLYAELYHNVDAVEGIDIWHFGIGENSSEVGFDFGFGQASATQSCAYVDVYEGEDSVSFAYLSEGGAGQFELAAYIDGQTVGLIGDAIVTDGNAEWLPTGLSNTVNILDLAMNPYSEANQAQVEKLSNEAMNVMYSVLNELGQANEAIAELLGM